MQHLHLCTRFTHTFVYTKNHGPRYAIISACNESGLIGPGVVLLLPSNLAGTRPNAQNIGLLELLNGSIAVFPDYNSFSTAGEDMWAAWPKTADNWSTLIAQTPESLEYRAIRQPSTERSDIGMFAYYTWDTTVSCGATRAEASCRFGRHSLCGGGGHWLRQR